MSQGSDPSYRDIRELVRGFGASGWTGMTLRLGGMRITVGKHGPPAATAPAPAHEEAAVPAPAPAPVTQAEPAAPTSTVDTTGCVEVRSPAVGAFWVAPSPGEPPFVQVGQTVAEGEQLGIVEVMKLMNPVVAPVAGEVVQVCAANAELVEYDQVLFWIRQSDG